MHLLVFLLEWLSPGLTKTAGATYLHSVTHWFDEADAHCLSVSDEALEAGNGRSKTNSKARSKQTM